MRTLFFHCKKFESSITGLSTRPSGIIHGEVSSKNQMLENCVLVFLTIEKQDNETMVTNLVREIVKFCHETAHNNVFLCPFAHLSNNLAESSLALSLINLALNNLKQENVNTVEGHFGSDKELLIQLYGHPGNARYREFN